MEDQIGAAEAEKDTRQRSAPTLQERERESRRQSLLLSRSRTVSQLQLARNERYREQLERTLEYLDAQLRELEATGLKKQ